MRLIFVTQTLDPDHATLGQSLDLVRALAERSEELIVLCQTQRTTELPANVRVRTFDAPFRPLRALRFVAALGAELRTRPDAILAHMVPVYVILAWPFARPRRIPLLLWYTHWHASRALRLATRLCDVVLSVDRRSFPLDSPKLRGIGHAIDVDAFAPGEARPAGPLRLLALGRTARRWKGLTTLLEGLRLAKVDAALEIRGGQLTDDERRYVEELRQLAAEPGLAGLVTFAPSLPRAEIPALLQSVDALVAPVEPQRRSSLDKAVFEAAACGVPVLTSNPSLTEWLDGLPVELRFPPRDPEALARALEAFAAATPEARAETGRELRRRVVRDHSLAAWADTVAAIVRGPDAGLDFGAGGKPTPHA